MEQTQDNKLLVSINGRVYSLPVANVEGVASLRQSEICAVPFDLSGRIYGIFSYKGEVTALARCQGLEPRRIARGEGDLAAVILRSGGGRFAIPVDSANEVVNGEPEAAVIPLDVQSLYSGVGSMGEAAGSEL